MRHSRFFLPSAILLSILTLGLRSGVSAPPALAIYPEATSSANPRIACAPPVARPGGGVCLEVEADFSYSLAPFVCFPDGGTLAAEVRNNPRRSAKDIFSLAEGSRRCVLRVGRAADGGGLALVILNAGAEVQSFPIPGALPAEWTKILFTWKGTDASLKVGDQPAVKIELPDVLSPQRVTLKTSLVDELEIKGAGSFSLGWSDGYAAAVRPGPDCTDVSFRLFGFDSYVISTDPATRDYPMLQILNAGAAGLSPKFEFELRGEVNQSVLRWDQEFKVPAHSAAMLPIQFPASLKSDVYHLDVRPASSETEFSANKHFLFVEKRNEPAGSVKFGLHDSDRRTFGFWPDALPIRLSHLYSYWGYTHGPAWEKDPGITAETPPAEWNWDVRLDWAIAQGLDPYVCVISTPFLPWMREREYEPSKMVDKAWGPIGGFPQMPLFRNFVRNLAERYKGKVHSYEVENEPNSLMGGMPPDDYVQITRAVFEETHAVDPGVRVFGICGTGDFVPWMRKIFELGGADVMDGVSIHTYVTPRMPEEANLPGKLAEVKALIKGTGKPMDLVNSETGTYVALREEVEKPLSQARLAELIKEGIPNLAVPRGWPTEAVNERLGGISMIRNVVYNFLAGAEAFTFFGWNDRWPSKDWWTEAGDGCFAMISASKSGVRTPSQFTLAAGVLTEQICGARHEGAVAIDQGGVAGGIFQKADGGEVAILWSPMGRRSAVIETPDASAEVIGFLGQSRKVTKSGAGEKNLFRLDLGEEPVYIQSKKPGLHLIPSPVLNVVQTSPAGKSAAGFKLTLVNRNAEDWAGNINFASPAGWTLSPAEKSFTLSPGGRSEIQVLCEYPPETARGSYPVEASMMLPDGTPFTFPIVLGVRPAIALQNVPGDFAWDKPASWDKIPAAGKLDKADQVVIGKPPLLASLQEEKYWKSPAELSGETKLAYNEEALFVFAKVQDANFRVPAEWPGVLGSSVEIFLDARPQEERSANGTYGKGVHQWVLKPDRRSPGEVLAWEPTAKFGQTVEAAAAGGQKSPDGAYWVGLRIPWDSLPKPKPGLTLGFDLGINGPPKTGDGRKTQLMLFGTSSNAMETSGFGQIAIPKAP